MRILVKQAGIEVISPKYNVRLIDFLDTQKMTAWNSHRKKAGFERSGNEKQKRLELFGKNSVDNQRQAFPWDQ
jgi:hypothetical protein